MEFQAAMSFCISTEYVQPVQTADDYFIIFVLPNTAFSIAKQNSSNNHSMHFAFYQ